MNQDKRRFPSIMLRMKISKEDISMAYFDKLKCKSPMFDTVQEMCKANYSELNENEL